MSTQAELDAIGAEVTAWLDANWRPGRPKQEWLALVVDAGYAVPTWPRQWFGRELDAEAGAVIAAAFRARNAPGARQDVHNLWANTALAFGTDSLKERFIRPLLLDQVNMCLLYSEPGAGSDLAGLQTRADRDGDEFVVNGQKVWTSGAKKADYGMLVARTNWDVPKHQGISFFWFPMHQPGVEVRPIRQITNESHFNEVFITDGRVPAENMLSGLNNGWRVLQTALAYERSVMGDVARGPRPGGKPAAEMGEPAEGGVSATEVDLVAIAKEHGTNTDPVRRQAIAEVTELRQVNKWNAQRAKAQLEQGTSSPILSLGKLAMSGILHRGAKVQGSLIGAEALLEGPDHPEGDAANFLALNAYFTSIGGGTDQIQRNIIGERVLGLPKEPEVDRDVPFKDVKRASVQR